MDTSAFFQYPTLGGGAAAPGAVPDPGFLPHATVEEWDAVLAATETLRFHPGDVVLRAGERDRALYLLLDGRLEAPSGVIGAITTVGEAAFLDGQPRTVTVRALTLGEVARLGYDAFLSLAARRPDLGRAIVFDVGRILAARLHAVGEQAPGWTG